ncbi:MAG: terminase [Gammaproteobacteria bacterium]
MERGHTITAAARACGVDRSTIRRRCKADPAFAARLADANEAGAEALEQEAFRRAVEGVERGLYYQGERYGSEREFSDHLLVVLLKARMPEKYRERFEVRHDASDSIVERLNAGRLRAAGLIIDGEAVHERLPRPIDPDDPILA